MKKTFDESQMELILFGSDVLTTSNDEVTESIDDMSNSMTTTFHM